jgi:hypothetical protein
VAGDIDGVNIDGASLASQPRFLTLGAVQSIAAGSGYYSVATASGQIRYFNASTNASAGTIDFPSSTLTMSSDGTALAATLGNFIGVGQPDASVNVYSLPAGTLINNLPYSSPEGVSISLSGSGTVLAQLPPNVSTCGATAVAVTGGAPIWCDTTGTVNKVQLSPDGTLVAASSRYDSSPKPTTSIYKNGILTTSVPGWVVGWLDNAQLLVDNYQIDVAPPNNTVYLGNIVYSSQGSVLANPALPEARDFRVISAVTVYSPAQNTIYSLTTKCTDLDERQFVDEYRRGQRLSSRVHFRDSRARSALLRWSAVTPARAYHRLSTTRSANHARSGLECKCSEFLD